MIEREANRQRTGKKKKRSLKRGGKEKKVDK